MDPRHEQEIRKAVTLAHLLAQIERAVELAERVDDLCALPEAIRRHINVAEEIAGDDLNASRRLLRGHVSR